MPNRKILHFSKTESFPQSHPAGPNATASPPPPNGHEIPSTGALRSQNLQMRDDHDQQQLSALSLRVDREPIFEYKYVKCGKCGKLVNVGFHFFLRRWKEVGFTECSESCLGGEWKGYSFFFGKGKGGNIMRSLFHMHPFPKKPETSSSSAIFGPRLFQYI